MKRLLEVDKRANIVKDLPTLRRWLESFIDNHWTDKLQSELNRHIAGEDGKGGFRSRLAGKITFQHKFKLLKMSFSVATS